MAEPVEVIRSAAFDGIPHGFLGRRGGVSTAAIAGLNVGTGAGDDPAAVAENRRRAVAAVLPRARLVNVYQVHSSDVVTVDLPWDVTERPRADAMVTDRPGVLLGILTADCAPVLMADRNAGIIGAAHAGWRGARGGVVENTVRAMIAMGARTERIAAAIGPCIAQASYEVSDDMRVSFGQSHQAYFLQGRPDHYQFDLQGYVASRLIAAGVARVERAGLDTYADAARFYSFRRATHRGEANYGRQISMIGLPATD